MTAADEDAHALAQACADAMWERDAAAQGMGMRVEAVGPGTASVSMLVGPSMLNGHAIAHGGFVFALADTAFAYACNSRNEANVALDCSITFTAPGRAGERLTATARERSRAGRTGVYDVDVRDMEGKQIALFRGTCYRIRGTVIPE